MNSRYSDFAEASSAETKPSNVNPLVIAVMREMGIDISKHRSKNITEIAGQHFDIIVSMCNINDELCPFFPRSKQIHQPFDDPSAASEDE